MRMKIVLQPIQTQIIEINYNYYLSSLIYHVLSWSSNDFSERLHSKGYSLGSRKFKLFCFSRLISTNYTIQESKLILRDKVEWYISSPVDEFIVHLADGLLKEAKINIGKGEFYISSVELLKKPEFKNEMYFRTLSPVTTNTVEVIDGKRKTMSCKVTDTKFVENIKNNLLRKYFLIQGSLPENMSFEMEIDEEFANVKGNLIQYKNTYIKGYPLKFRMKGDRKLLKVAYDAGIGEKGSAGMGMIDIDRR